MRQPLLRWTIPVIFMATLCGESAKATSISYVGNLRTDANVTSCGSGCTLGPANSDGDFAQYAAVVESFTVSQTSTVQAITFSYGGGVNGAGTTIAPGGFEPYLSLFDAGGDFLASTYFGTTCPAGANINPSSGFCYDVLLDGGVLAPGTYQIAISAYLNMSFAENLGTGTLADGFTGLGNLFDPENLNYAFDVDLTPQAPVPEPVSIILLGTAGAFVSGRRLKRR
jgi:hypothetical protein